MRESSSEEAATNVYLLLTEAAESSTPVKTARHCSRGDCNIQLIDFYDCSNVVLNLPVKSIGANSQFDFWAYVRLARFLYSEPIDVLHVHPIGIGFITSIISFILGINCVTTEHSQHTGHSIFKKIVNTGLNSICITVVSNSEATADSFAQWEQYILDIAQTNHEVIYYGVDIEQVNRISQEPFAPAIPDGFVIGTAGRLIKSKNIGILIDSLTYLSENNAHLVIAGDGPCRDALELRAKEIGIENSVHFLGWIQEEDQVYRFLGDLDVFVFPSLYEGLGLAVIEAMAAGTPVISNDIPVLREVVGNSGILIDAEDPKKISEAVNEIRNNSNYQITLVESALRRTKDTFHIKDTARKYNQMYRSVSG